MKSEKLRVASLRFIYCSAKTVKLPQSCGQLPQRRSPRNKLLLCKKTAAFTASPSGEVLSASEAEGLNNSFCISNTHSGKGAALPKLFTFHFSLFICFKKYTH